MKREPITMLQLRPDPWGLDPAPLDQLAASATIARRAVAWAEPGEEMKVRPMMRQVYSQLLWVLEAVSRAKVAQPRRLTWRERITGRLKP